MWLVWAIQQYAKMVSWDEARVKYGKALKDVMDYLAGNHHPNLKVHENDWFIQMEETEPLLG